MRQPNLLSLDFFVQSSLLQQLINNHQLLKRATYFRGFVLAPYCSAPRGTPWHPPFIPVTAEHSSTKMDSQEYLDTRAKTEVIDVEMGPEVPAALLRLGEMTRDLNDQKEQIAQHRSQLQEYDTRTVQLGMANLLISAVKIMFPAKGTEQPPATGPHATTSIVRIASRLTSRDLIDNNLDTSLIKLFGKLSSVCSR